MSMTYAANTSSESSSATKSTDTSKDLSEWERYRMHRDRNNMHVKRSRQRKVDLERRMRDAYVNNEKRIVYLQKLANNLAEELSSSKRPKEVSRKQEPNVQKLPSQSKSHHDRPAWFGVPFWQCQNMYVLL